ncbi:hypothetical protein [Kribbella sp. NPDC055071]
MTILTIHEVSERSGLQTRLEYLREKAALWDARDRGDATAEADSTERLLPVMAALGSLGVAR